MNRLAAPAALSADLVVADGVTIALLVGELTIRTATTARDLLEPLSAGSPSVLRLDLEQVTEIDAAGMIAVTAPAMAHRRDGARIEVRRPAAPEARRSADRIGVLDLLPGPSR